MSKSFTRTGARLLTLLTVSGGALAVSAGAAAAANCTSDPIPDPNVGVYACYDYAIQDSDPSNPGAEVSTAAFVDVDVYGQARICIGRVIVGGQVDPAHPLPLRYTATTDGLGARVC